MSAWLGWSITLAILFFLAMVKVGIQVRYEQNKLYLALLIFKFRVALIGDEKEKNPKKEKTKQEKAGPETAAENAVSEKKPGKVLQNPWVRAILDDWRELVELIGRTLTTPTLDVLQMQVWVGGEDAAQCAMTYGRVCAAIGAALPVVENTFGIRRRKINVWCCYDRLHTEISVETAITVRIYEMIALAFALLGLGIKIFSQARKYKKAVQPI